GYGARKQDLDGPLLRLPGEDAARHRDGRDHDRDEHERMLVSDRDDAENIPHHQFVTADEGFENLGGLVEDLEEGAQIVALVQHRRKDRLHDEDDDTEQDPEEKVGLKP